MWMGPPHEATVEVPHLVGLPVVRAMQIAAMLGIKLSTGDPDGPPLSALTWQRNCYVTEQRPEPGFVMRRKGSVEVAYRDVPSGDDSGVREPRVPRPPQDLLTAERELGDDDLPAE